MDFAKSERFHNKYFCLYDKIVCVTFKDGKQITGLFNDEFFEDESILVDCQTIKIDDIQKMELVDENK